MLNETLHISGKSISPGLAEGVTFVHHDILRSLDAPIAIDQRNVDQELGSLEDATAIITDDLVALATRVEQEMDMRLSSVFEAHQLMLNDPTLKEELRAEIRQNLVSASSAVRVVFLRWEKRFLLMESQVARHKGDDMRDLSNRLSNALSGIRVHPLEKIPEGSILVAKRLLPSDTVFLARHSAAAVLLEYGGAGSHAALFAREMGLPCVADIPEILRRVPSGVAGLVDADKGEVIIHPRPLDRIRFQRKVADRRSAFLDARDKAREPALTKGGVVVEVLANVGCRADSERALANGADGIGLYRTEKTYLARAVPPSVEELRDEMRDTLEPFIGKPVHVRLLDIGADKPLPFLGFLAESNPALGRRGIRLLRDYPGMLEIQIRAILMLCEDFDVSLLIPMVTLPDDIMLVREQLERIAGETTLVTLPRLGAMIETPAAALSAGEIAVMADFVSFGTNDLTQYAFAADRENAAVESYFRDSSEVIFRLMRIAREDAPDLPLSVCGELAGRTPHIPRILESGVRTLSVAPSLIPLVKEAIRQIP